MKLTTRHALDGAVPALGAALANRCRPLAALIAVTVPALGAALANRCRPLAALIAVTVGLGLAGQLPAEAAAADSAGLTGDVRVGHKIKNMVVPGTELCFNPSEECTLENRKVRVHLWYPADQNQPPGNPNVQYKSQLHGFPLPDPLLPLSWKVHGEFARENAAIDPNGGAFPVIVFSHGNVNDPIDYAHTLERIASGGFVVAAPYHTNNTQDDVRRDFANAAAGTTVFPCEDGRPSPCSHTDVPLSMADRVRDIDKVVDEVPGWFGDRVDANRAGLLGHSRGTATALAAAGGTFPLTDPRARTANCQGRTKPPIVSPDGIARCWPLAPGMEHGLSRVKAVMGMAIAARPITRAVDLENVAVPTLLVSGSLDQTSPEEISDFAAEQLGLDRTPRPAVTRFSVPNAVHRTFDSTYCDQMQAAGASADKEEEGRIGNGDGEVSDLEYDDWQARARLDRHTVDLIVRGGTSGSATQYCSSGAFTNPVDITSLVTARLSALDPSNLFTFAPDAANVPVTGLDTDTVKQQMTNIAVPFFHAALGPVG